MDTSKVKVGDKVWFKDDVEQAGIVENILSDKSGTVFVVRPADGFSFLGGYSAGLRTLTVDADRCW